MAEGAGLLNQYTGNRIEGSNPSLSANIFILINNNNKLISIIHSYLQLYLQKIASKEQFPQFLENRVKYGDEGQIQQVLDPESV